MQAVEVTSMSTKGQIVIPSSVRNQLNVSNGTKFVVITDGQNILLKPIEQPKLAVFKELLAESMKYTKENGLKKSSLNSIIKKDRRENRP